MSIADQMKRLLEAQTPKTVPIPELKWESAKDKYDDQAVMAYLRSKEGDLYTLHAGNDYKPDGNTFNGKWQVSIFRNGEGRIFEKRGLASFEAAEKAVKAELGKVIAAKRFAEPPEAVKATSAEDVADLFQGKTTKTGGRLKVLRVEKGFVYIEPLNRERLDHYGTSYSDDGEEQEGWDDEGWSENYAIPLYKEVEAILKSYGIKGWSAEIGEKGHIDLQRSERK